MRIWERMRTKIGVAALLAVLLTLCATTALAVSYPFTGVITDDTNMRSTASSAVANVIRRVAEGDVVEVTGASGNFYRIEHEGKTGYVFKQYVEETKATLIRPSPMTASTCASPLPPLPSAWIPSPAARRSPSMPTAAPGPRSAMTAKPAGS